MPSAESPLPTPEQNRAWKRLHRALDAIESAGMSLTVMDSVIYAFPAERLADAIRRRGGDLYEAQRDTADDALSLDHAVLLDCGGW